MKKLFALLLVLAMVFGMVACGQKAPEAATEAAPAPAATEAAPEAAPEAEPANPYEGVTVTWWTYPYTGEDQSYWDGRAAEFYEKTGITVETTIIPWGADGAAKLSSGFLSGQGPDVLYMTAETAYDLIAPGHLLDLATVLPAEILDDEIYAANTQVNGKQYMLPFSGGVAYRGMAFNMDLLKAAGVEKIPETREELVDAALKLKAAGNCEYPVLAPMATDAESSLTTALPTIWSGGGDIVSADGTTITVDTPENLESLQWLYDLVYKHEVLSQDCTGFTATNTIDLFIEGKVGILFAQCWPFVDRADEFDFEWDCNFGVGSAGNKALTFAPIDMVSVNANAKNQDAAIEWLKFLISVDQRNNFRETNYPTLLQLNKSADPISYEHPSVAACMEIVGEHTRALPIVKGCQTMVTDINTNVQLMLMDELTPAEAIAAIQAACETAIG